jgi:polysaccharide export outer membrane protein
LVGFLLFTNVWSNAESSGYGQTQQSKSPDQEASDYRVGPGDLLEITVFGFEQLDENLRVSGAGMIRFPLLEEITVAGLTTSEIEEKLVLHLKEAELFKAPDVKVKVQEFRSRTVFVLGTVRQPGQYHLSQPSRLIDVLSLSGGVLNERAEGVAIIQRHSDPQRFSNSPGVVGQEAEELAETITVDLERLLEKGDLSLNHSIQDGDVISVPEKTVKEFFIIGEVNRPGAFELKPDEGLLLSQAVARAGGPMKTASMDKGILARYDTSGARQEIPVNLEKILKGESPDLPVLPDDVIFIPGSTFKSIAYGLLGVIPRTVSEGIVTSRYR